VGCRHATDLSQGALEYRELKNDLKIVRDAHKCTFTSTYFEELQLETRKLAKDADTVPSTVDLGVEVCATRTQCRSATPGAHANDTRGTGPVQVGRCRSPESDTARQSPCTPQRRSCFDFSQESSGAGRIGRVKRKVVQTTDNAILARALEKELSHAGPHRLIQNGSRYQNQ
jgi:hypothetical protein